MDLQEAPDLLALTLRFQGRQAQMDLPGIPDLLALLLQYPDQQDQTALQATPALLELMALQALLALQVPPVV